MSKIHKVNRPEECDCYIDGICCKMLKRYKCQPASVEWFDEKFEVIEMADVCRNGSIFGNAYFAITDDDIKALKEGKVLFDLDEYGTLIAYKRSNDE